MAILETRRVSPDQPYTRRPGMGKLGQWSMVVGVILLQTGCSLIPNRFPWSPAPPMAAPLPVLEQARRLDVAQRSAEAANGRLGAVVCRSLPVGLAEQDWIRGQVLSVQEDQILVRVDDPGRFLQSLDGVDLKVGSQIRGKVVDWFPCTP